MKNTLGIIRRIHVKTKGPFYTPFTEIESNQFEELKLLFDNAGRKLLP